MSGKPDIQGCLLILLKAAQISPPILLRVNILFKLLLLDLSLCIIIARIPLLPDHNPSSVVPVLLIFSFLPPSTICVKYSVYSRFFKLNTIDSMHCNKYGQKYN